MHNFYEADDFSLLNMTAAINTFQVPPSKIGRMGLFRAEGITTSTVGVEMEDQTLKLIPAAPRGYMPEYKTTNRRSLIAVSVPHLPKNDSVQAESLSGLRALGSDAQLATYQQILNNKLRVLRQEHELTWEYHRIGALQGAVKDADGSTTLIDWFSLFGVTRITVDWDTGDSKGLKKACQEIKRRTEDELKLTPYDRIQVVAGWEFWQSLTTETETATAFERWQNNSFAREQNDQPFRYSEIDFMHYGGGVGSTPFVPTAEAFSFPVTQAGLYEVKFAPAPFLETVNTPGKPYYAKQKVLDWDTGTEIHTQSNPLFICKRPRVLIRITKS